jgi:hypothetical protein
MYAASLSRWGAPRLLPACGGHLLVRAIAGSNDRDAMGPYPLFCCRDWRPLSDDLLHACGDLVSVTLVTDPFGECTLPLLHEQFDRVVHFKDHFVADLSRPIESFVKPSHRDTVRRALKRVEVRICPTPMDHLDAWVSLFDHLVARHHITGLRAFSRQAFAMQLATPGLVMFEALAEGQTVGLDLWYVQGDVAYGHLVAFNDRGYELRASYATKWRILQYFADMVRWIDFGGGAGARSGVKDGLTAFKEGWATGTRPVYLCGKILQPARYRALAEAAGAGASSYFPAYRVGEFA